MSPAAAAASLRARDRARAREAHARAEVLRALLPQAAATLRELGAKQIWAFGSLVNGNVHPGSDMDLAVLGLSGEAWASALGRLSQLVPAEVDLVRIESATPSFADRIRCEGRVL